MKLEIIEKKEVEAKFVKISVYVRYGEEDIPNDFPLRTGDMWNATIDLDTHQIQDWPQGETGDFSMKICDEGSYYLLDEQGNQIASIEGDYVPNSLLPGSYGDYLGLEIDENGFVTNWLENPTLKNFEGQNED